MHATLLVILPEPLPDNPSQAVETALAPFCCNVDTPTGERNPNSKWDWWDYGGRWDGFYTSGHRISPKDGGFNFDAEYRTLANNIGIVGAIPPMPDGSPRLSCAILTPDGVWHENPSSWNPNADDESWTALSLEILDKYRHHHFAALDVHS